MLKKFPKTHLFAAIGVTTVVATAFVFSPARDAEANRSDSAFTAAMEQTNGAQAPSGPAHEVLSVNDTAESLMEDSAQITATADQVNDVTGPEALTEVTPPAENWSDFTVKSGDTLSHLFAQAGYDAKVMYQVLGDAKANKALTRLYVGETLSFLDQGEGRPAKIRLKKNALESLVISQSEDGRYSAEEVTLTPDVKLAFANGTIDSSLYLAAKQAGLNETITMELAEIFAWDVDFVLDIRSGDSFSVLYEEQFLEGKKIGHGRILAASFTNQGEKHQAILYAMENGQTAYFAPDGSSMKGEFLRSPIAFARISSHFSLSRKHPVLHRIRAHKGTDYAAGNGTPIRATGEGKVILAGRKGGYGKTVILQHGHKYTTLYAHLSKYGKGIRSGKRVRQGQVIGYVGSTGLATGPHLHYEFRVAGVHKNPVTVKLPKAESIPQSELTRFQVQSARYLAMLDSAGQSEQLALNQITAE